MKNPIIKIITMTQIMALTTLLISNQSYGDEKVKDYGKANCEAYFPWQNDLHIKINQPKLLLQNQHKHLTNEQKYKINVSEKLGVSFYEYVNHGMRFNVTIQDMRKLNRPYHSKEVGEIVVSGSMFYSNVGWEKLVTKIYYPKDFYQSTPTETFGYIMPNLNVIRKNLLSVLR